ncbi:hypothetical protein V6Z11_A05G462300 [Gossypium hirsutum]
MKTYYEKGHGNVLFSVGDSVWLQLQSHHQCSLGPSNLHKLSPCFYCPSPIIRKIDLVAYELQLPSDIKIHNVFHVSLMKAFKGDNSPTLATIPPIEEGRGV